MAAILLIVGALLVITCAAIIYWPSAFGVAGALALAAGVDLAREAT